MLDNEMRLCHYTTRTSNHSSGLTPMTYDVYNTKTQQFEFTIDAQDLECAIRLARRIIKLHTNYDHIDCEAIFVCLTPKVKAAS